MVKEFITNGRFDNGYTYSEYMKELDELVHNSNPDELPEEEKSYYNYRKLNLHRSHRIDKTYQIDLSLADKLKLISSPQKWLVLTESWCGDSAQNLPHLAKMAELNENIELKILYRDENLDIMDQYLTDGKARSIPKLIVFDSNGKELFNWGPRPTELINLVNEWKTQMSPDEWKEKIHVWYAQNKGKALEQEIFELLKQV